MSGAEVPDLNATAGGNGGLVIALYRDHLATDPNVTHGLLDMLAKRYGTSVEAEDVLAYVFALMGTGAYSDRFGGQLEGSMPRVPFTADLGLFSRVATLGRELLWGTFGERFAPTDANGRQINRLPPGTAKSTVSVPNTRKGLPTECSYDPATKTVQVGSGQFAPVDPAVAYFEVSGMEVVPSWLAQRISGARRPSSALDKIRPETWTFSIEFAWSCLQSSNGLWPRLRPFLNSLSTSLQAS